MERNVRIADRDGVRVLTLAKGKANPFDTELAGELHRAAITAEQDASVKAVVLTSASPSIFSGGFDLVALGRAEEAAFDLFLRTFDTLFLELFLLEKPLVAALTGHAIAAGALVAGAADFRFAAEGTGRIGLPEAALGVVVPRSCLEALRVSIGDRALTRLSLGADTLAFADAKELGAIDRILPAEKLLDEAVAFAARLGRSDSHVYAAIKHDLRGPAEARARAVLQEGRRAFIDSWFSEPGQKGIAAAVKRMQGGA